MEKDPLENTKYEMVARLGRGAFGSVVHAKNTTSGEQVAIKLLKRVEIKNIKYVAFEIENHSKLRHPHVIQFKEVFLTSEHICIVMEYASGGSLFHFVQTQRRLKEAVARWFFQQLVIGVDYCHKKGVVNRDIKLENTLLQNISGLPLPLLKICDFGYSKSEHLSAPKSKVGTLTYMAPEILMSRDSQYDGKVADIWSCGVMLYVMLYGRYPFDSGQAGPQGKVNEIMSLLDIMVNMRYPLPDDVQVSSECKELLRQLLQPDPAMRITLEGIMSHPWFKYNLPPEATTMNTTYLNMVSFPGQQPQEEIRRILQEATSPRQGTLNITQDEEIEDMIDSCIRKELNEQTISGPMQHYVRTHRTDIKTKAATN